MNSKWHNEHILPKGASIEERIAWHREHQRRCACRPMPAKLQTMMANGPHRTGRGGRPVPSGGKSQ